ncbi:MAG: LEA type 2 family protein [Tannerellaceae bacterium]|nr:LEA type 2 family protein [Tannerellaceae bacterium]
MKTKFFIAVFAVLCFLGQGCGVTRQVGEVYNLTQCRYDYHSISQLNFAGVDLSRGVSVTTVPQVLALLSGSKSSLPLNFTINLDVTNPNQSTASLHGLDYILRIDNVEFTRGAVNQSLNVPSGGTLVLPLAIGVDLATLLSGDSKNSVENIVKNFIGIGNENPPFLYRSDPLSASETEPFPLPNMSRLLFRLEGSEINDMWSYFPMRSP